MFAVVRTGGKQYRVTENQKFSVEKLPGNVGESCILDSVLLIEDGSTIRVGDPLVEGAKVVATIAGQTRSKKVLIFKKKRRHTYRRKKGHRQDITVLLVHQIARPGDVILEPKIEKPVIAVADNQSEAQVVTASVASKVVTDKSAPAPKPSKVKTQDDAATATTQKSPTSAPKKASSPAKKES